MHSRKWILVSVEISEHELENRGKSMQSLKIFSICEIHREQKKKECFHEQIDFVLIFVLEKKGFTTNPIDILDSIVHIKRYKKKKPL
jgi:hypothetical protein